MGNKRRKKSTAKITTISQSEIKPKEQDSSKEKVVQKKHSRSSTKSKKEHAKPSSNNSIVKEEMQYICENVSVEEAVTASSTRTRGCKRKKAHLVSKPEQPQLKQRKPQKFEENSSNEESGDNTKKNTTNKRKNTSNRKFVRNKQIPKSVAQANQTQSPDSGIVANDNSSDSEWEEVQERDGVTELEDYNPEIPKEGVEITLNTTTMWGRKKCQKKEIDMNDIIRRQINNFKKNVQIALHKVHLLCLFAHGQFMNAILLQQDLSALMLSVIPLELHKFKGMSLEIANKLIKWFCEHFHYCHQKQQLEANVEDGLKKSIQECQVYSPRDFNMLFILALRSLGVEARLCLSLNPISLKPNSKLQKKTMKHSSTKQGFPNKKSKLDVEKDSESPIRQEGNNSTTDEKCIVKRPTKKKVTNVSRSKFKMSSDSEDENTSDDDFEESSYRQPLLRNKVNVSMKESNSDLTDDSDDDFVLPHSKSSHKRSSLLHDAHNIPKTKTGTKLPNRKILSFDDSAEINTRVSTISTESLGVDYWAEIYAKDDGKLKWICVDCINSNIGNPYKIEKNASHSITYVLAYDNDNCVKDVTKRYASKWMTHCRKIRVDEMWWQESLKPFLSRKHKRNKNEDAHLDEVMATMPLPTTIGEFKDHPLYALKRHLLKFQAIYPPDAPPLGFVRKEAVYARECVHTLHSRETWLKQARVVKIGEEPYKIVKARPKWNKITREIETDHPLEIFGKWQTEEYAPPVAENGKVPRNEYGNVDLFQPSMIPIGTVHVQIPGLNRVARKLGIDCCPAVVGFDGNWGSVHPVFDGWIVCKEFKDTLLAAWDEHQENQQKRDIEKREKRIYGNWKRLIKGLLIREKLRNKYDPISHVEC